MQLRSYVAALPPHSDNGWLDSMLWARRASYSLRSPSRRCLRLRALRDAMWAFIADFLSADRRPLRALRLRPRAPRRPPSSAARRRRRHKQNHRKKTTTGKAGRHTRGCDSAGKWERAQAGE